MSVVVIGPKEQAAIDALVATARASYTPWEELQRFALFDHKGPELTLADRKGTPKRPEQRHLMLGNVEVAFSFEEQPVGLCRHLSVAVAKKGKLPHPAAVEMIAKAFGFTSFPPVGGNIWIEEYEPGRRAINVVEVAEPAA
jgi:hypothetical protein